MTFYGFDMEPNFKIIFKTQGRRAGRWKKDGLQILDILKLTVQHYNHNTVTETFNQFM